MKRTRIQKLGVAIPVLLIILLATVFPFQIHIEDVLTLQSATDFGFKVSIWRVIFEPFLGTFLYLNRSIYALHELSLTLFWVLVFYSVLSLTKTLRLRVDKKKMIFNVVANLFLLIGICFAIFVLVLFIPLPNNTIVNNSKNSVLVTTHAHTEFSHDGLTSQGNMWEWHKRNGFDAFFLTDHANHKKSLAFAQKQRNGEFPINPLILVGQEHSGSNHMSLLGLKGKFETKGIPDKAIIDSVHKYGGAVIVNHWFDGKGKEKGFYKKLGVDGFEIENSGKNLYYNREIFDELKKFCKDNQLTMVGGLDFHGYGRVCSLYNAVEISDWKTMDPISKESEILRILKNGPQEKIKILIYKDRPFYRDTHLLFRPFWTLTYYFRTLNLFQVLSWILWLVLFQLIWNRRKQIVIRSDSVLPVLASGSAIFMIGLALIYYFRGESIIGYSEVYFEYATLLGPIGLVLLVYAIVIGYFRFLK